VRDIWLAVKWKPSYIAFIVSAFIALSAIIAVSALYLSESLGLSGPTVGWIGLGMLVLGFQVLKCPFWLLWRREVRPIVATWTRQHHERVCPKCAYLLRSDLGAFCPECGEIVPFLPRAQG